MTTQPKLGQKVKDIVTGHEGIAVCRTEWLNGCVRYGIQGKKKEDGTVPDAVYVDVEQIEVIDDGVTTKHKPSGGDRPEPRTLGVR